MACNVIKKAVRLGQFTRVGPDAAYVKATDATEETKDTVISRKRKTPASDVKQQSQYPPPRFDAGGKCLWPGCGKIVKGNRPAHWYTHTGERPYKCQYCNQGFTQRAHRDEHERTHTGEQPYQCRYCDQRFSQRSYWQTHERRHTGEKPYQCQYCDRAFADSTDCRTHERIHTGEKPYKCQYCDQAFTTPDGRNSHERTHTGEKPYPCRYCGYGFTTRSSCKTHERVHTGEKPYPCQYENCDYASTQKHARDRHEISQHTMEGQQRKKWEENRMHKAFLDRGETPDYGGQGKNPNQYVDLSCVEGTSAYPDFVFQFPHMLVLRECDEFQHRDRMLSCEMKRMVDIVAALRVGGETRPIVFMRINPHSYKVDGVRVKTLYEKRIDEVVAFTKRFKPTADFTIVYCYFSVCYFKGKKHRYPEILMDCDFPEELKPCVMCLY